MVSDKELDILYSAAMFVVVCEDGRNTLPLPQDSASLAATAGALESLFALDARSTAAIVGSISASRPSATLTGATMNPETTQVGPSPAEEGREIVRCMPPRVRPRSGVRSLRT